MNAFCKIQSLFHVVLLLLVAIDVAFAGGYKSVVDNDYSKDTSFAVGEEVFHRQWLSENSEEKHSGLGPLYDANSCNACHINNGRGHPPINNTLDPSFVMRLSIPPQNEKEKNGVGA